MGKTSKPVTLFVDQDILDAAPEQWEVLKAQGHDINVFKVEGVVVAPYAMRMTAAMVTDLPKSIELLIKGARALQHSPTGTAEWQKGKSKGGVQNKGKGKRKNSKVKAEGDAGNEHAATAGTGQSEGTGIHPASEASNLEGDGQVEPAGGQVNGKAEGTVEG